MRLVFKLLKLGMTNPRFYIEAIAIRWRHLIKLSFIYILLGTIATSLALRPSINHLTAELHETMDYLPAFAVKDHELTLADDSKALYYQSNNFQLVIDDQIDQTDDSILLNDEQMARLDEKTLFNLFLFKDSAYLKMAGQLYHFNQLYDLALTDETIKLWLESINLRNPYVIAGVVISALLSTITSYGFIVLLATIFAGIFNLRLTKPINFNKRLKLILMMSFVPLLILQFANIFVNFIPRETEITLIILMIIYYFALKNHSEFIQKLLKHIDHSDQNKPNDRD